MSYFPIKGVLPPMITPFTSDGELDLSAHQFNLSLWNTSDLAGYLVLGSNSETVYLNEAEKLDLIRASVEVAAKDRLIIAGTGLESTRETIRLTNLAAKTGADCALLLTPNYYGSQMNEEAQVRYFTDVADQVDLPILIYNVTKFTHINISPTAIERLANHPNIIGMKDSSGSLPQLVQFKQVIDDAQFNLLVGTASAWYPALDLGIKGSIMALANCSPNECVEIQTLFDSGRREEARALYERMFPLNHAVTTTYGIAGLKYVCNLLGYRAGNVRRPMLELKESERETLRQILRRVLPS